MYKDTSVNLDSLQALAGLHVRSDFVWGVYGFEAWCDIFDEGRNQSSTGLPAPLVVSQEGK